MIKKLIISIFLLLPFPAWALTPIARTDVVPYQRIENGSSFNFGVVAFSKAGIDRVDFAISGQGYSGGTKSSSTMALNTRVASGQSGNPGADYDGVWEYYVTISASEFSSNGAFTVTPTVYGDDAGEITLAAVTLYVEGASNASPIEAWISTTGNDGTGTVNNQSLPYATFAGAMADIETANSGVLDYATIYLEEGSYDIDNYSGTTSNDRLKITRASGADIDSTILNNAGTAIEGILLKLEGLSITSQGSWDYVVDSDSPNIWIDKCKLIGANRQSSGSNPVYMSDANWYITDSYIYNVDFACRPSTAIARGLNISTIANDAFEQNAYLVVNCQLDYQHPGSTGWHADVRQTYLGAKPSNSIMFNVIATDLYYQGLFFRIQSTDVQNTAFVNVFVQLAETLSGG